MKIIIIGGGAAGMAAAIEAAHTDEKVEIFEQNNNYYKVLFENGKIGWVNSQYLIKK